ncbi:DUF177 domain-containing protein [candidate division KSB1 bacterium]|nr:DUF177 domain-containing protein [candidate division KSB1 bacterium]
MDDLKLKISHLADGVHEFHLQVAPSVCGLEEHEYFHDAINVDISLQKFQQNFVIDVKLSTQLQLVCDRCLIEFNYPVDTRERLTYSFDKELAGTDEEIKILDLKAYYVDLAEDVRDFLLLALPSKMLCSKKCAGICAGCGIDLNVETCRCEKNTIDPRWNTLKDLLNNQ